jgi:uncharacterized membrane protein YraQ (UPF0718 family)
MFNLYTITGLAVLVSFLVSRQKTCAAVRIAVKRFWDILPAFLIMLIFVSVILFIFPGPELGKFLGKDNRSQAVLFALVVGSVTLVPGFVAFPLCGILLKEGVSYMVLSAFTTTLMMVGVVTYPIERRYFGAKVAVIRNGISFLIALAVAVMTGVFFGEIF